MADEDCYTDSTTYQGKVTCTVGGITCDVWTTFGAMPAGHPDKNTNYCRDPDYTGTPWCYTTDLTHSLKIYCSEMKLTDTFVLSGDVCGGDERLPVVPTGTTSNFHFGTFIGMVFTCDTLSSGTSVDHCPVSQCGTDDQWTTGYNVSCTGDVCGGDERLPVVPTGTTSNFHFGIFIGMVFTCDTLSSGTSVDHCPVSQCGTDDQWTTGYSVSCTDKDTNYCRDPDNTGAPWCYTTDPDERWDYCPVPKCA
ncbi:unnamed protein product [Mytilus edulis]|uniref:Kringle domain-containing protein n=1 Tax=Mytilus edulis TaxID=6550 RepID=A0A8S3USY0_MYTED|nr:unnamed protein product [Mytilus edulis]